MNFSKSKNAVSNIPSSWFNLRAESLFAWAIISLKFTVKEFPSAKFSEVGKE
jgi:hypothetical protein